MATCYPHERINTYGQPCPYCEVASLRAELEEAKAEINELAPWSCVDCGPNIKIDEAGCCAMCGRDAAMKGDE